MSCCSGQVKERIESQVEDKMRFVSELKAMPVAINTAQANEQHYEVRGGCLLPMTSHRTSAESTRTWIWPVSSQPGSSIFFHFKSLIHELMAF